MVVGVSSDGVRVLRDRIAVVPILEEPVPCAAKPDIGRTGTTRPSSTGQTQQHHGKKEKTSRQRRERRVAGGRRAEQRARKNCWKRRERERAAGGFVWWEKIYHHHRGCKPSAQHDRVAYSLLFTSPHRPRIIAAQSHTP